MQYVLCLAKAVAKYESGIKKLKNDLAIYSNPNNIVEIMFQPRRRQQSS